MKNPLQIGHQTRKRNSQDPIHYIVIDARLLKRIKQATSARDSNDKVMKTRKASLNPPRTSLPFLPQGEGLG